MPTNKIALRTVEEVMSDYTPVYQPVYPLFLSGKAVQYNDEVGEMNFRRVTAVGDIRGRQITPKDTEIKQISVMEGKKSYKRYFLANQFILSRFQDTQGVEEVQTQVLDEHQLHQDELFMLGDGTSPGTVLNNGLYYSSDPNYTLEDSVAVVAGDSRLYDFHAKVMTTAQKANQLGGRKVIIFYGTNILPLYNSLFNTAAKAVRAALQEALGPDYSLIQLPDAATPSGANGWLTANLDQVKTHYTLLPQILNQGVNEENMYVWTNFAQGSMMVEVLAPNAIIRQPATLA